MVERILALLPSFDEIKDEIGDLISQLLCGPKRFENREELRRRLIALKDSLSGAIDKENVINDVVRALDKLEEIADEVIFGVEKSLKKARLLTISLMLALGAILLDRHWRGIFDTVMQA